MITIGTIFLFIGALFIFLGALGIFRMPDAINKLQAGTKATTLGFVSIIVGVFFIEPGWWAKLLVIGFFVLFTNPIGSHNLARAAHDSGEEIRIDGIDELQKDKEALK